MKSLTLPEIWNICIDKLYDRKRYANGLVKLLQDKGITPDKKILDAACGTGFPAIELIERDYDVICSDGSPEMSLFCQRKTGGKLIPHVVRWEELTKYFLPGLFDAVLLRGNSLPYIISWFKDNTLTLDIKKAKDLLFDSLRNISTILKEGGIFYFDLFPADEKPHEKELGEVEIDGVKERWYWKVDHLIDEKTRTWTIDKRIANAGGYFMIVKGYIIDRQKLFKDDGCIPSLIHRAGFNDATEVKVDGEDNYTSYIATKIREPF